MNALADLAHEVRAKRAPHGLQERLKKRPFVAVCLRGPVSTVPRHFGDNMGGRPVALSTTTVWRDKIGKACDAEHYICEHRVLARVWVVGEIKAKVLVQDARAHVLSRGTHLRGNWYDLGPDMDASTLTKDLVHLAETRGMDVWTDIDLVWIIDQLNRQDILRKELG